MIRKDQRRKQTWVRRPISRISFSVVCSGNLAHKQEKYCVIYNFLHFTWWPVTESFETLWIEFIRLIDILGFSMTFALRKWYCCQQSHKNRILKALWRIRALHPRVVLGLKFSKNSIDNQGHFPYKVSKFWHLRLPFHRDLHVGKKFWLTILQFYLFALILVAWWDK